MTYPLALRLVIGASRGSASHIVACALAPYLSEHIHQQVNIEVCPGNNGLSAATYVSESGAEGDTVLVTTLGMHVMTSDVIRNSACDINTGFLPISMLAGCPLLLAVHPTVEATDLQTLTRLVTESPGKLTYASSAIGGAPHLATELYSDMVGGVMQHVVYQETEALFADLVAGRVALSFNNIMTMSRLVTSGKLRGIAVTSKNRATVAPDVPTFEESGLSDYEVTNWLGIVAPAGTEPARIAVINGAVRSALESVRLKNEVAPLGIDLAGSSPEEFTRHICKEQRKWKPVVDKILSQQARH